MKLKHDELFRALEPPPGGPERFRQRLARHAQEHTRSQAKRQAEHDAERPVERHTERHTGQPAERPAVLASSFSRRWLLAGSTVTALVAVAVVLFGPFDSTTTRDAPLARDAPRAADALVASVFEAPEFDRLLGRASAPADLQIAIGDEPVSVSELASTNARIRIYEIRSN